MSRKGRFSRFVQDVVVHTPFLKMLLLMIFLWVVFSASLYVSESQVQGSKIETFGNALYWGVAAFSTAGIADTPVSGASQVIGAVWIVLGSSIFFGTIVATITTYFMRPLHRPAKQLIETIEYNLEQLDSLTLEELELLKETTDALIIHMEKMKKIKSK